MATKQTLVLGAPEELTRLVANRIGEFERTRQSAHFARSVGKIPFRFRPPVSSPLFATASHRRPIGDSYYWTKRFTLDRTRTAATAGGAP